MTPFPNKITVWGPGVRSSTSILWETQFSPQQTMQTKLQDSGFPFSLPLHSPPLQDLGCSLADETFEPSDWRDSLHASLSNSACKQHWSFETSHSGSIHTTNTSQRDYYSAFTIPQMPGGVPQFLWHNKETESMGFKLEWTERRRTFMWGLRKSVHFSWEVCNRGQNVFHATL